MLEKTNETVKSDDFDSNEEEDIDIYTMETLENILN